jgi:hypothetical protein
VSDEDISGKGIGMLLAIHSAVRRDLARLAAAVAVLADPTVQGADRAAGAAGLSAYWDCLADQLHHHHTIEDSEVFPFVRGALGRRADAVMDKMGREHDAIDEAQALADAAVRALSSEPSVGRASAAAERLLTFQQVVLAHLAHEEAEAVPLILEGFDEGYWLAFMGRRQQDPGGDTFLPWVLESAPAPAVAEVTGSLPPAVHTLLVQQWQPAHAARVEALPRRR